MNLSEVLRRYRVPFSVFIGAVLVYLARPSFHSLAIGVPFVVLGEAVRVWSSGHIRKNRVLSMDGPYAYTRNPLYLGSFFIGLGFALMGNTFGVMAIYLTAFPLIYGGVIRSEENDLARVFGAEFVRYVRSVPRFIPRLTRTPQGGGRFDWSLVWKHREYQAWLGILGGIGLMAAKTVTGW